jgi:DHA2 family multidrug resistance protein
LRDRLGYRVLYLASLAVFTLGSLLCGLAPNLGVLVGARVIQAMGGGAITPTGMAMIAEVFPPERRGRALGVWGVGAMAGPALGPTLGGYLTDAFGWRSIFNVNLPIGVVGLWLAGRILREDMPQPGKRRGFDLPGFVLLSSFLVSTLLGLSKGNQEGWTSRYVLACGLVSAISLVMFLAVESVASERILDLGLFRSGQFTVAMVVTCARSVALYGGTFLLPLFLQNQMARSEIDTGLLMLPGALAIAAVMPVSGRIAERLGTRVPTLIGLAMTTWFLWTYRRLDVTTSTWSVLWPTLIRGVGLGLLVTPVMTVAINAVPTRKAGMASSMLSLIQQVSGSLGIAALAAVLVRRTTFHLAVVGQGLAAANPVLGQATRAVAERVLALGRAPADATAAARALALGHAAGAAQVLAFDDAFLVGAGIVLLGMAPALFLTKRAAARAQPEGMVE